MKFFLSMLACLASASLVLAQETENPGLVGWNEVCGTIVGTKPCTNSLLRCCYLHPDFGVCRVKCPTFTSPPDPVTPVARK
ncbi:hypothetical protein CPB83DRAFT_345107 [Crepidotus variabilis]|uniref:Beta-defensin n=1 Tax=Crepidotus variabilis TaxID=179855 RepID=A0A9P6EFZ7_9AGAR|nr:hypothetical protein CPB83DRAFT_345107 [Crepidotus variabilis]